MPSDRMKSSNPSLPKSSAKTGVVAEAPKTAGWIKIFVLFHLLCITAWSLPNRLDSLGATARPTGTDILLVENQRRIKPLLPVRAYLFTTGFWQYWDMFAPNPSQRDFYGDAIVEYANGKKETYQYPRMYLLPIMEKYPAERYRKFYERAHLEQNPFIWSVFAQRIARVMDKYQGNPPKLVRLRRNWRDVAAPGKPQIKEYSSYEYFRYQVRREDLEQPK